MAAYSRILNGKIYDPVSDEELVVYSMRGESDEISRADTMSVIRCIASEYNIDEEEAARRLQNSDCDDPIAYRDQVFWTEAI
jgi:hypothetical protein